MNFKEHTNGNGNCPETKNINQLQTIGSCRVTMVS